MTPIIKVLAKDIVNPEIKAVVTSVLENVDIEDKDMYFAGLIGNLSKKSKDKFLPKVKGIYENIMAAKPGYANILFESNEIDISKKIYLTGCISEVGEMAAVPTVLRILNEDSKLSKDVENIIAKCKDFESSKGSCHKLLMEAIKQNDDEHVLYHLYTALSLPENTAQTYALTNLRNFASLYESVGELLDKIAAISNNKLNVVSGEMVMGNDGVISYKKVSPIGESKNGVVFNIGGNFYKERNGSAIPFTEVKEVAEATGLFEAANFGRTDKGLSSIIGGITVDIKEGKVFADNVEVVNINETKHEYRVAGMPASSTELLGQIYDVAGKLKTIESCLVVEANNKTYQFVKKRGAVDLFISGVGLFEDKHEFSFEEANSLLRQVGVKTDFLAKEIKFIGENREIKTKRIQAIQENLDIVNAELKKINELEDELAQAPEVANLAGELQDKKKELEIQLSKEQDAETDDILEKISDKILFFINKIKDTLDNGSEELQPEYTTDGYVLENGISVKITIKGTNVKTYKDINSSLFLLIDSQNKDLANVVTEKDKDDIATIMGQSNVENFEDWKRSLRTVISNLAAVGVEAAPDEEEETPEATPESLMQKLGEGKLKTANEGKVDEKNARQPFSTKVTFTLGEGEEDIDTHTLEDDNIKLTDIKFVKASGDTGDHYEATFTNNAVSTEMEPADIEDEIINVLSIYGWQCDGVDAGAEVVEEGIEGFEEYFTKEDIADFLEANEIANDESDWWLEHDENNKGMSPEDAEEVIKLYGGPELVTKWNEQKRKHIKEAKDELSLDKLETALDDTFGDLKRTCNALDIKVIVKELSPNATNKDVDAAKKTLEDAGWVIEPEKMDEPKGEATEKFK